MRNPVPLRWIAVAVFVLASALNYMDRFLLATMADIWRLKPEFPFSYSDYGLAITVFSIAYALSAPLMGFLLDRLGLNFGITLSVALWSLVSIATGFVRNFNELLVCRGALGAVEASGISAHGKMGGMYLLPKERAVGAAMAQVGLSLGSAAAPLFATYFAYGYGWRWAFYAAGLLGFLWIPLWLYTSRKIPTVAETATKQSIQYGEMLRDPRLWALTGANFLSMTVYTLWTNWTPPYLVRVHNLSPQEAAHYSWVVPICGYFGAFLGGSMSWYWINRGLQPVDARKRVCLVSAVLLLSTMAIPLLPTPLLATVGMSFSFFCIAAWSTNLYTIPVDIYGGARAAFGVSALVFAYGAMQAVVSRPLGRTIEQYGFGPVCLTAAFLPLAAYALLSLSIRKPTSTPASAYARVTA